MGGQAREAVMRAPLIAFALLLTCSAVQAQGTLEWGYCRLWPSRCVQPPPVVPAPPPVVTPLPPERPAVTQPAPPVAPKAKAVRVKPKWKPAPAKARRAASVPRVAPPAWCLLVPRGTTMQQIEAEAVARGRVLSASDRAQARACIASK
jgi:hypothetical protein